jgi:hypothetical protein
VAYDIQEKYRQKKFSLEDVSSEKIEGVKFEEPKNPVPTK